MKRKTLYKDLLVTAGCLAAAAILCSFLSHLYDDNNPFAMPVFILAVALTARFTRGYVWGVAASVVSVLLVNTFFTYPFGVFTLSMEGYPLNFFCLLTVSVIISTLTTRVMRQEEYKTQMRIEKMRADLLRCVSHDLRTPLAAISGACSALSQNTELPREEQMALLGGIDKDAQWLIRVTENLLSVSRFSDGRAMLKLEEEVPEEILSSAASKFRRLFPSITVRLIRPDEIFLVPMDSVLIEQVLINLMENAALHGQNTDTVTVSVEKTEGGALFRVSDNGAGFTEKQLRAAEKGLLPESEGAEDVKRNMGIGLSVCRSIVEGHNGIMKLRNGADGGAEVSFLLALETGGENGGDTEPDTDH